MNPFHDLQARILRKLTLLASCIALIAGAALLIYAHNVATSEKMLDENHYLSNFGIPFLLNIGCGLLVAGALAIFFEWSNGQILRKVTELERDNFINWLREESSRKYEYIPTHIRELLSQGSIHYEKNFPTIDQAHVAKRNPNVTEFLQEETDVTLIFKDGFGFFSDEKNMTSIKQRILDKTKRTKILLFDFESPDYEAVERKRVVIPNAPKNQKDKTRSTIDLLRTLAGPHHSIIEKDRTRFEVRSYDDYPCWIGYVSPSRAIISFYRNCPHGAELPQLTLKKSAENDASQSFFNNFIQDAGDLAERARKDLLRTYIDGCEAPLLK
jgi:hypothetical protein